MESVMREFGDLVKTALMDVQSTSRQRHTEEVGALVYVCFRFDTYRDMDPVVSDLLDSNSEERGTCADHIAYALPEAVADQFGALGGVEIERISREQFYEDYARE